MATRRPTAVATSASETRHDGGLGLVGLEKVVEGLHDAEHGAEKPMNGAPVVVPGGGVRAPS